MYRTEPNELLKALDETRMALYVERNEKSAMEKKIIQLEGVIAHQDRKLDASIAKCADYDRMKQEFENVKNQLAESKAVHTGPPKRLLESICVKCSSHSEARRTVVERGALLPVAVSRPLTLTYDRHYEVCVGDKCFLADFPVGPAMSSSSRVSALITVDIGASGVLTGSIEYDGIKMDFKNVV